MFFFLVFIKLILSNFCFFRAYAMALSELQDEQQMEAGSTEGRRRRSFRTNRQWGAFRTLFMKSTHLLTFTVQTDALLEEIFLPGFERRFVAKLLQRRCVYDVATTIRTKLSFSFGFAAAFRPRGQVLARYSDCRVSGLSPMEQDPEFHGRAASPLLILRLRTRLRITCRDKNFLRSRAPLGNLPSKTSIVGQDPLCDHHADLGLCAFLEFVVKGTKFTLDDEAAWLPALILPPKRSGKPLQPYNLGSVYAEVFKILKVPLAESCMVPRRLLIRRLLMLAKAGFIDFAAACRCLLHHMNDSGMGVRASCHHSIMFREEADFNFDFSTFLISKLHHLFHFIRITSNGLSQRTMRTTRTWMSRQPLLDGTRCFRGELVCTWSTSCQKLTRHVLHLEVCGLDMRWQTLTEFGAPTTAIKGHYSTGIC